MIKIPVKDPDNTPQGNAAAMRQALKYARDVLAFTCRIDWRTTMAWGELHKAIHKANAALSAPPRNCDVGTAEEQEERLNEFCSSHFEHCSKCPLFDKFRYCQTAWMQMPYEMGEEK